MSERRIRVKKIKKTLVVMGVLAALGGGATSANNGFSAEPRAFAAETTAFDEACALPAAQAENQVDLELHGKSAYLMEFSSQKSIYRENEKLRLPIASMCKIMTSLLVFEEIEAGNLQMSEEVCVSERAASMGGSQVFLEANAKYSVRELLKSIIVCSANDSCVALAERICGSEKLFVERMNEKAKAVGANDTLFANCTGLPKDPQYSCAHDVAIMLKCLLAHEDYYAFGNIWTDRFEHPKGRYTKITNTNKLVRFYDGCDGGKTGFTNEAGFCLAATAKRDGMRVISVVIGEENSKQRFADVRTMLDYAFANYGVTKVVSSTSLLETPAAVRGGKRKQLSLLPSRDCYVFTRRGEKPNVTTEISTKTLKAPIKKSETVGEMLVFKDGIQIDRIPLLAAQDVERANFFDCLKEVAENWNGRR